MDVVDFLIKGTKEVKENLHDLVIFRYQAFNPCLVKPYIKSTRGSFCS